MLEKNLKQTSLCLLGPGVAYATCSSLCKDVLAIILAPCMRDDLNVWLELDFDSYVDLWVSSSFPQFASFCKPITFFELFQFPQVFLYPSLSIPFIEVLMPS